jgi:hypothetical protein
VVVVVHSCAQLFTQHTQKKEKKRKETTSVVVLNQDHNVVEGASYQLLVHFTGQKCIFAGHQYTTTDVVLDKTSQR